MAPLISAGDTGEGSKQRVLMSIAQLSLISQICRFFRGREAEAVGKKKDAQAFDDRGWAHRR